MPTFTYTGDDGRYYPDLGVGPLTNGQAVDLPADPDDGRWSPTKQAAPTSAPALAGGE